ncbi:hypothetical protein STEG23_005570, partial [Scotinomys teguina]
RSSQDPRHYDYGEEAVGFSEKRKPALTLWKRAGKKTVPQESWGRADFSFVLTDATPHQCNRNLVSRRS